MTNAKKADDKTKIRISQKKHTDIEKNDMNTYSHSRLIKQPNQISMLAAN